LKSLSALNLNNKAPGLTGALFCYLLAAGGAGGAGGGGGGDMCRGAQPVFTTANNPISSRNAVIFLFMVAVLSYNRSSHLIVSPGFV
jgi:hypothetical protein